MADAVKFSVLVGSSETRTKTPNLIFIRGIYVLSVYGFHDDTGDWMPENEFVEKRLCVCVINAFEYLNEGIENQKKTCCDPRNDNIKNGLPVFHRITKIVI